MQDDQIQIYQNTLHPQILKERPIRAYFYDSGPYSVRMGASVVCEIVEFFLNPIQYDGSLVRALKRSYETNEAGFMIGGTSILFLIWSLISYRRTVLNQQKKIFVYQEYQKRRYLQRALGLKIYTKDYDYFGKRRITGKVDSKTQK